MGKIKIKGLRPGVHPAEELRKLRKIIRRLEYKYALYVEGAENVKAHRALKKAAACNERMAYLLEIMGVDVSALANAKTIEEVQSEDHIAEPEGPKQDSDGPSRLVDSTGRPLSD